MEDDSDPYVSWSALGREDNVTQENIRMAMVLPVNPSVSAMSQWVKVMQNPEILQQMQQHYPSNLPIEVRYFLSQWIEEQPWDQIDEYSVEHAPEAEKMLTNMLEMLRYTTDQLSDKELITIKIKLDEYYTRMLNLVKTKSLEIVKSIKDCLLKELSLFEQSQGYPQPDQMACSVQEDDQQRASELVKSELESALHKTHSTEAELRDLQQKQESFIIQFSDSQKITTQIQQLSQQRETPETKQKENQLRTQKDKIDIMLTALAHELLKARIDLAKKYEQTIVSLQELQKEILDNKLINWKRRQQLAGNGLSGTNCSLEKLQRWCEDLADLIWQNRQQIKKSTQLQQQLPIKISEATEDLLPKLNEKVTNLLSSIVTSTFIVEQQPPQVLKKDAKFGAAVCLLVGGKLSVHMNPPQVKATIISEHQARELLKPKNDFKAKDCSSGEILNNRGTMEYQSNTGHLGIKFRNMQLKKIKRADKRGSEAVTEEKFCILFQSEFTVGGTELVFQVWTLSLPVVVTVHGNQECNATATVLWDNAFADPGRIPFMVPDQVEWNLLAEQLNMKFKYQTGKGLSKSNLDYLATKLFGDKDPSSCKVSWAQFNKDTISNRAFTFWEWFYAILKLTKEHLKDLWTDEAIVGFVSKNQAQNMLVGQPMGTFLLRFSDSEIGGITIAWTGEKEVLNLAPFSAKDFNIRGLADRIRDLSQLVNLYPDKPKDDVFSKYYTATAENMNNSGYIQPVLKTTIPEQYKSTNEAEVKQPLSQEYYHDSNLNSINSMGDNETIFGEEAVNFSEMDFIQIDLDYMPDDIDQINDISVDELMASHQVPDTTVVYK